MGYPRPYFANLKQNLFPYFDHAVSGLLDDLRESGRLADTLVVITDEDSAARRRSTRTPAAITGDR
ncbi:MAG: hypothetical protein U0992_18100 [Planctomycetaceae bacterium]